MIAKLGLVLAFFICQSVAQPCFPFMGLAAPCIAEPLPVQCASPISSCLSSGICTPSLVAPPCLPSAVCAPPLIPPCLPPCVPDCMPAIVPPCLPPALPLPPVSLPIPACLPATYPLQACVSTTCLPIC